jgi:hypothetical protein
LFPQSISDVCSRGRAFFACGPLAPFFAEQPSSQPLAEWRPRGGDRDQQLRSELYVLSASCRAAHVCVDRLFSVYLQGFLKL